MADSDRERRRRRRRRIQSAPLVRSDDIPDRNHYTTLVENRLRAAELLPVEDRPIVAMQTRHVNNYQHSISFRQQFVEHMAETLQDIDRRLEANRRKEAGKTDKEKARIRRHLEREYSKKVRELELDNDRDLVRKLVDEHLKKSTPEGQLRRIEQLEEDLRKLREQYDQLAQLVHRNQEKCDQNKREHDDEITEIRKRFEDYRLEIDQYKKDITKIIADLEGKLKPLQQRQDLLNKKQEEHTIAIEDLSRQREILNKLSFHIEQIINARRADLNKMDQFTKKLDDVRDLLNQVRDGLQPLSQIPSLKQELQEIRNLFIEANKFKDLESRVRQVEELVDRHNDELRILKEQLNTFESSYRSLKDTIDSIRDNDLVIIIEQIQTMTNDFNRITSEISEAKQLAQRALEQVNELRRLLDAMTERFSPLDKLLEDIADIKARLENLENQPDDSRIQAVLDDLMDKFQEFLNLNLVDALENLRRRVEDLEKSVTTTKEPTPHSEKDLEEFFQKIKREILDPIFNFMQEINGQINDARTLINDLRTQLNQLLNRDPPSIVQPPASSKLKLIPYIESLPPIDLLDNIWTSEIHSD